MMNEDNQKPTFMTKSIDMKMSLINGFHKMIEVMKSGETQITIDENTTLRILMTFGTIEGNIINETHEELIEKEDYASLIYSISIKGVDSNIASFKKEIGEENIKVVNYTERILLSNVTLIPFANPQHKFTYERLLIFSDQIVGVTVASS